MSSGSRSSTSPYPPPPPMVKIIRSPSSNFSVGWPEDSSRYEPSTLCFATRSAISRSTSSPAAALSSRSEPSMTMRGLGGPM